MTLQLRERQLQDLAQIGHRNAVCLIAEDFDRSEDALHFFDVGILAGEEVVLHARIAHAVDEDAARRQAVAAGAARLLRVGLERARQIVVHDEADVRFVDAQPERVGRDDRADRLVHEQVVHGRAILFVQFRVVDRRGNAELARQVLLHFERVLDRGGVDDAGALERVVAGEERGEDLAACRLPCRLCALRRSRFGRSNPRTIGLT